MKTKTTSLVLGSGGARGLSHIGVIRYLQEHGYQIDNIAGSSIGALIGGIHAAGQLSVYSEWVTKLQRSDIFRLLDPAFGGGSLLKGERIIKVLTELIGDHQIENLPVSFTAVATDLTHAGAGREVWLTRGSLFKAIRASIAVPTLFAPVESDGRLLVDGSVLNPLPVAPTLHMSTRLTVAVNLNGRYDAARSPSSEAVKPANPTNAPGATGPDESIVASYGDAVAQFIEKFWPASDPKESIELGFSDLALRTMETMQASITDFRLASSMPEIVVHIPSNTCSFFEFHRAQELIDIGYERTAKAVKEFEANNPSLNG